MKIKIANITKKFNETKALNNISFEIEDGEMIGLLGPSGCGKTTLLMVLSGLLEASSGEIYFDDENVIDKEPNKREIGMVFQDYALYPHMTVEKNILFPLKMKNISKENQKKALKEISEIVQIEDLLERKPSQLSGGQMQRVAIARALIKKPKLLLLDEPLSNLDARLRIQLRDEIRKIQNKVGITTVFVTHDQEEAMSISDRIVLLENGNISQFGTPRELFETPQNIFAAKFLGNPPTNILLGKSKELFEKYLPEKELNYINTIKDFTNYKIGIRPEYLTVTELNRDFMVKDIQIMGREQLIIFENHNLEIKGIFSIEEKFEKNKKIGINFKKALLFDEDGQEVLYEKF